MGDSAFALREVSKNPLLSERSNSSAELLLHDIAGNFLYSLIQEPLDGVTQLIKESSSGTICGNFELAPRPAEAEFGSFRWHAQQAASAAGMQVPFMFVHRAVSGATCKLLPSFESKFSCAATSIPGILDKSVMPSYRFQCKTVIDSTLSGAIYDGLAKPVEPRDGQFLQSRLKNSITG